MSADPNTVYQSLAGVRLPWKEPMRALGHTLKKFLPQVEVLFQKPTHSLLTEPLQIIINLAVAIDIIGTLSFILYFYL